MKNLQEFIDEFGNNDEFHAYLHFRVEEHLNKQKNYIAELDATVKRLDKDKMELEANKKKLTKEINEINQNIKNSNKHLAAIENTIQEKKHLRIKLSKETNNNNLTDEMCIEHLKNSKDIYEIYVIKKIKLT